MNRGIKLSGGKAEHPGGGGWGVG